ncbi:7430_t:CDS:2, partial [Funneliformis geosporum]
MVSGNSRSNRDNSNTKCIYSLHGDAHRHTFMGDNGRASFYFEGGNNLLVGFSEINLNFMSV